MTIGRANDSIELYLTDRVGNRHIGYICFIEVYMNSLFPDISSALRNMIKVESFCIHSNNTEIIKVLPLNNFEEKM